MKILVESVSFRYPDSKTDTILDASIFADQGSSISIIGPNGCGKSTLLSLAVGSLYPYKGRVLYSGKNRSELSNKEKALYISWLPQIERFTFQLTALEYVLLGRIPWIRPLSNPGPEDERKAMAALERVGLHGFNNRHVTALSGGELQLARLARCLAQETDIIVLDEPTSMLDPANSLRLANTMRDLSKEGKTLVFSTHDASFARYSSDFVFIMRKGKIVHSGKTRNVISSKMLSEAFEVKFQDLKLPTPFL